MKPPEAHSSRWLTVPGLGLGALLALCLAGFLPGSAGATEAGTTKAAKAQPERTARALPGDDQLVLRSGETLKARVQNEAFTLRTPYGRLTVPRAQIARLDLAPEPTQMDVLVTMTKDRFSGLLEDADFLLASTGTEPVRLRREKVQKVSLAAGEAGAASGPKGLWFRLRNGDAFTGELPDERLMVATTRGEESLPAGQITALERVGGAPAAVKIQLGDGRTVQGNLVAEDLEVALGIGSHLRLYQGFVETIQTRAASDPTNPAPGEATPGRIDPPPGARPEGMVWIRPGTFLMGSPPEEPGRDFDEGPQTEVRLTHGFWMATAEVTQAEYKSVMGINPSTFVDDPQRPVEKVTWREAMEYCDRLTQLHSAKGLLPPGYSYRLPTEAEWEYACRAGTSSRFSFGEDAELRKLPEYAWFGENADFSTHPVRQKQANPWGLFDMHGNVLEWCLDHATTLLPGGKVVDYRAPKEGLLRVARGGSWLYGGKACRSANRDTYGELTRCSDVGFRVVLVSGDN